MVPLRVVVDEEVLEDGSQTDAARVYDRLRKGGTASTSTPSPGDYLAAFEELAETAGAIVCLTIPSKWSGMFQSATVAAEMFAEQAGRPPVKVIETNTAAASFGLVARVAAGLCARSATLDQVLERVESACAEVRMYGALATLEFVARSGRVPTLVASVSDALHVRPVFEMAAGDTSRVALARTESGVRRALERVATEKFEKRRVWLMLWHADAEEEARRLGEQLAACCDVVQQECVALSPVIGVHTGPGAIGFAALPLRDNDPE